MLIAEDTDYFDKKKINKSWLKEKKIMKVFNPLMAAREAGLNLRSRNKR